MTASRRRAAGLVLALAVGLVAACNAATDPVSPPSSTSPFPAATAPAAPSANSPSPAPSVAPSREPTGDLGREITIEALDPAWTSHLLEFASDGESVIFSSGALDGSDGEYVPDLWRYLPGADGPELLWQNQRRDRSLVKIGGEFGTWAFVSMPLSGEIAWEFWLLPEPGRDAILLDSHPGAESFPDFVPSFHVHQDQVAWTAFDVAADGTAVSQLLYARAPDWQPVVLVEREARVAEIWLPSMRDTQIAYCEVVYSADRATDERHVYVVDAAHPGQPPRRLDTSGRATMPLLLINDDVVWKEADPGFNMFNWGHMFRFDEETGDVAPLGTGPQEYVNYPSGGTRFIAWWGAETAAFGVYDTELRAPRLIDRWPAESNVSILRPHISWDLLVWLHAEIGGLEPNPVPEIRFAFMPGAGTDRDRD